MQTNKYKQPRDNNVSAAFFSANYLSIPKSITPQSTENLIYNVDGNLYWENNNLCAAIAEGSKWSLSSNNSDIYRNNGKIGIGTTSPTSELDVNGKIKTKDLQIGTQSGFLRSVNGNVKIAPLNFSDIENVEVKTTTQKQILYFDGKIWTNIDISGISHSDFKDLEQDDHQQYLNNDRHNFSPHSIKSLDVDHSFVVDSGEISINAPLFINNTVILNSRLSIEKLELIGLTGILISKNGEITTGVTTSDIPEGNNQYYQDEKVLSIVKDKYLALDGSNSKSFSGFKIFIEGLDADKLDGKESVDFALVQHTHPYNDLIGLSIHDQKHDMNGDNHIINGKIGQFLKVTDDNTADFGSIYAEDLPLIPFNKIGNGEISGENLNQLKNIKSNIQEQLNNKSDTKHSHNHNELQDLDQDQHLQYFDEKRINDWIQNITTSSIKEGDNLYYSDDKVEQFLGEKYVKLDGSNASLIHLSESLININSALLNGLHSSDFSLFNHQHDHNSISNTSPNDHHSEIHDILTHTTEQKEQMFLKTISGELKFDKLSPSDMPLNIPISNIGDGKLSNSDISFLSGTRNNIQEQIDSKSARNHVHNHTDLTNLDQDNHQHYYNTNRLEDWFSKKTLDDIKTGSLNKHINAGLIKEVIQLDKVLYWDDIGINIRYDNTLKIDDGILSTIQDISENGNISLNSLKIKNINTNKIGINVSSPKLALEVIGGAIFDKIGIPGPNGVIYLQNGVLTSGAKLKDLSDVDISLQQGVLVYKNDIWKIVDPKQIISIPTIIESFNSSTHMEDEHEIRRINVNGGVFSVDKDVKIGNDLKPVNTKICGNIYIEGVLNTKNISFISEPRSSFDLGMNDIIAGPKKIFNTLSLFSNSDESITLSLYDGIKFKFNSIDLNNEKVASFDIVHDGIVKFDVLTNKELMFSVGEEASVSFLSGGLKVLTISDKNYIGLGTPNPLIPVDSREFFGIANFGSKPTNWLMFRTDIPSNDPLISFPKNKKLLIGSYDNYSMNGIWDEILSVSQEKIEINRDVFINGQVNQPIMRKKVEGNEINSDSNIIKLISAEDDFTISGIIGGFDGKQMVLMNWTGFNMTMEKESDNSSPNNRISSHIVINNKKIVNLIYDSDEKRWHIVNA